MLRLTHIKPIMSAKSFEWIDRNFIISTRGGFRCVPNSEIYRDFRYLRWLAQKDLKLIPAFCLTPYWITSFDS